MLSGQGAIRSEINGSAGSQKPGSEDEECVQGPDERDQVANGRAADRV